jgi:hypothetical protein
MRNAHYIYRHPSKSLQVMLSLIIRLCLGLMVAQGKDTGEMLTTITGLFGLIIKAE